MIIQNKDEGETNNQDETKEVNYEVKYKGKKSIKTQWKHQ